MNMPLDQTPEGADVKPSVPAIAAVVVDQVCDEFESAWKGGQRPDLEQFLARHSGCKQEDLLQELLSIDLHYRWQLGEKPSVEEYQQRFPNHRRLVLEVFGALTVGGVVDETYLSAAATTVVRGTEPRRRYFDPTEASAPGSNAGNAALEDFEMLERIGRGGMGVVYRARHRESQQMLAIKVLRPDLTSQSKTRAQQTAVERILIEVAVARRLVHPNIVNVIHSGQSENQLFYTMPYIRGRSLWKLLKQQPIESYLAARWTELVARAVHFAHEHGVMHRDFKPHNILIDHQGNPYILDFGLARNIVDTGRLTLRGDMVGTPSYMAPELIEDASTAQPSADIYGLGSHPLSHAGRKMPVFRRHHVGDTGESQPLQAALTIGTEYHRRN